MSAEIKFAASAAAQSVLDGIGRTEDLKFSPSGRRLAVAGFKVNKIVVFEIDIRVATGVTSVTLGDVLEVSTEKLRYPHGLSFLDEDTLVVANRNGNVVVVDAPPPCGGSEKRVVAPRQSLAGGPARTIETPGSVCVVPLADQQVELLVCNNYANNVSRHVLDGRRDFASSSDEILLRKGLDIPDGICTSADGRWLAVSNHNTSSVLLYDRHRSLNESSEPDGVLQNVLCPHGVRFTPDQAFVLVADAGSRFVNVYARGDGTWHGTRNPFAAFPAVSDRLFARGRHNPEEGGPKGIDVDDDMRVLACTCESQALAFFDLPSVLRQAAGPGGRRRREVRLRLERALFRRTGYVSRGSPGEPPVAARPVLDSR